MMKSWLAPVAWYFSAVLFGVSVAAVSSVLGSPIHGYLVSLTGLSEGALGASGVPFLRPLATPEFWILLALIAIFALKIKMSRKRGSPETRPTGIVAEPELPQPQASRQVALIEAAPPAPAEEAAIDVDLLYRAALRAAEATGGISPPELALEFEELTGLAPPEWALGLDRIDARNINDGGLGVFGTVRNPLDRQIIMALVLKIGCPAGRATPRVQKLIEDISGRLRLDSNEVKELFSAVHTPEHNAGVA